MKRFFAIFLCIFILTFNTITVKAMDIGVAIEVGQEVFYAGWDQILALINGVVIPTSQYAGAADKTVAMAAFYDDWLGTLSGLTQYWGGDIAESETSAISINYPLDYGMSGRYANQFLTEYANLTQDVNNGFALPLNGNVLAAWNRYNNLWIQRYLNAFNDTDIPSANPLPGYEDIRNAINGSNCDFILNKTSEERVNGTSVFQTWNGSPDSYSYFSQNFINSYSNIRIINPGEAFLCVSAPLTDVNIVSSGNNVYSVTYSFNTAYAWNTVSGANSYTGSNNANIWNDNYNTVSIYNSVSPWSNTFTGSLDQCLYNVTYNCRNVNLYVDGVLWFYAGGDFVEKITAPDVIRNESDQVIGNDVYFPEQDLLIDLINWQNLVDDKILSGEDITFDDLIDAGVITDAEGNIIDQNDLDSYFKKKSISGVIDDALDDTQAIALVPDLPVPPDPGNTDPFNWNFPEFIPDIPDGDFTPRQTGLSVLARIVNVTNQSLPGELIAMFWGIVITLVILGIIKIAHK